MPRTYQGRHGRVQLGRKAAYVLRILQAAIDRKALAAIELVMQHLVAIADQPEKRNAGN